MGILDIFNHQYPYTDFHELNLDWIIKRIIELDENLKNFINLNTIKYANPILWDITRQYEANTVVVDATTGDAYISIKAVPSGVQINRIEYWTQIYNYANVVNTLREQIAHNEGESTTATRTYSVDDLVFVNGDLYKVIHDMIVGDSFVVDSNITKTTIENELNITKTTIENELNTEANTRATADNQLQDSIENLEDNSEYYKNYLTPQMYGAIGDGVADDTLALQTTLNEGFLQHKNVFIPSGNYRFTHLDVPCATLGNNEYIMSVIGSSRSGGAILKHIGTGVAISVVTQNNGQCNGINLSSFTLEGNENTTIGIELPRGTRVSIERINMRYVTIGIQNINNFWLSSIKDVFINCNNRPNSTGINIAGGSVTSLYLNEIYVIGSTDYAYKISGAYHNIGVICADSCTGNGIFYLNNFNGSINALACELADVANVIYCDSDAQLSINDIVCWRPTVSESLIKLGGGIKMNVNCINVGGSEALTVDKPLAYLIRSNLYITSVKGNYTFNDIENYSSTNSIYIMGNLNFRGLRNRPYLGYDRANSSRIYGTSDNKGVAIFTDCHESPAKKSDGTLIDYTPTFIGDWYIESRPDLEGCAGYVMLEDNTASSQISSKKRANISLTLKGSTADRPTLTTRATGTMYFDTTLNKPIWFNGTRWVDSNGSNV